MQSNSIALLCSPHPQVVAMGVFTVLGDLYLSTLSIRDIDR